MIDVVVSWEGLDMVSIMILESNFSRHNKHRASNFKIFIHPRSLGLSKLHVRRYQLGQREKGKKITSVSTTTIVSWIWMVYVRGRSLPTTKLRTAVRSQPTERGKVKREVSANFFSFLRVRNEVPQGARHCTKECRMH